MNYVISDIHGKYDLFLKLLKEIAFNKNDKLYILGDIVDRGEDSISIFDIIMNDKNMYLLMGNHEEMFMYFLDEYWQEKDKVYLFSEEICEFMEYLYNMKKEDNYRFITDNYFEFMQLSNQELRKIHLFIKDLPLYATVDDFILCHAGLSIPYNDILLDEVMKIQTQNTLLWIREDFYENNNKIKDKTIIFGHTPTELIDEKYTAKIWRNKERDKIGIDCGAYFNHTLGCLRLDDMQEIYITN